VREAPTRRVHPAEYGRPTVEPQHGGDLVGHVGDELVAAAPGGSVQGVAHVEQHGPCRLDHLVRHVDQPGLHERP